MSDIFVKVVRTSDVELPVYQTSGSAGCDVRSAKDVEIAPGERVLVPTGLHLEIPEGFECQIRPRSSLALKHGIVVFNSPSTIDSDYRGEVGVLLINTSKSTFTLYKGDRIAQFVFAPVTKATFMQAEQLEASTRGVGGWGSTGVR
jgi:dUTP pyrophosphatase